MQHALAVNSIRAYQPLLEVETQDLLKRLLRDPKDYVGNLRRYAGGLTLTTLYGYHASTNDDKLLTLADECVDILSNRIAAGGGIWPMDIFPFCRCGVPISTVMWADQHQCNISLIGPPVRDSSAKLPSGKLR